MNRRLSLCLGLVLFCLAAAVMAQQPAVATATAPTPAVAANQAAPAAPATAAAPALPAIMGFEPAVACPASAATTAAPWDSKAAISQPITLACTCSPTRAQCEAMCNADGPNCTGTYSCSQSCHVSCVCHEGTGFCD